MSIRIKISEVNIEHVKNGKNQYDKAEVIHTSGGMSRSQKIMSFSNPAVFKIVQNMRPGEDYDITVTKNDAGFNQWAKIERVFGEQAADEPLPTKAAPQRTAPSTYETAEERKIKQLYIVRQSSISNAIEYFKDDTTPAMTTKGILEVAQEFVDFVYGYGQSLEEMDSDLEALSD